ncbi:MAG: hypothetical protein R6V02_10045 [Candidatus Aminicenantes bacterium]
MKNRKPVFSVILALALLAGSLTFSVDASAQQLDENILKSVHYREIGPTRQGGRFVDYAWNEKEPNTFYLATASGHLWKTVDNGISYKPLFTHEEVFSIGSVAVTPSDPKIVWVGSGEANNSRSSYWGNGMYKSTDGGETWTHMGLDESHHIGAIEIHPENPDILYVAALGHLYSENPERGLYKTTDGGKTWTKSLDVVVRGKHIGAVDCVMSPGNPDVLYAATYDKERKPYTFNLGGPGSRIYKTTDAGATWTQLKGGLPEGMLGRIGLDVYLRNPDIVYAVIENANKPGMSDEERYQELQNDLSSSGMIDGEVYRSDNAGETWRKVSPDDQSIGGAPGYYYGKIIIDPNDPDVVHVLSAASWGTYDSGKTWERRPLTLGGDDHALWIDPRDSNHMWLGYDHGMGFTYDGGKNWHHPDNLPLAQFYAVGLDMSYPYRIAGGTQDNGSLLGPSTKRGDEPIYFEDWSRVGGGDGMYNEFDWKTNRYLYNESQFGVIQRLDLKTGERKDIGYRHEDPEMRWNWCSPIVVSPHNPDVIYHAGNKVVRSPFRGETWEVISPDLSTNNPEFLTTGKGGDGNIQYCTITAFDESPLVEGLFWAGTDDGNVWVSKDGGENWTQLNEKVTGNPGYWVSRITPSNHRAGTAYLSYTGYRRDDFRAFLYKTDDYGQTWTSLAAGLPDEPVNVIREAPDNPNVLFVGTEFAVYVSIDRGKTWSRMKGDMPTQPVHDIKIHPREKELLVATHGRGFFVTDISWIEKLGSDVLDKNVFLFPIRPQVKWVEKISPAYSSANFEGESKPLGIAINYYLSQEASGQVVIKIFQGEEMINQLEGTGKAGMNQVVWDMTRKKERSEADKKRIKELIERYAAFGHRPGMDPDYENIPVNFGDYRVVLEAAGKRLTGTATVQQDHWFDRSY